MKLKELLEQYSDVELTEKQEKQVKDYLGIKDSKKWRPIDEENYYIIDSTGVICQRKANSKNPVANMNDNFRFSINNCFKTKEEAEFRLEQIKVYNELKNFADENNNEEIDWTNQKQSKYMMFYDYSRNKLESLVWNSVREIPIDFSSKELVNQAIEKVGADRIKKYLFGVGKEN